MGSFTTPISPRKLQADLYCISYNEDSSKKGYVPPVISILASLLQRTITKNERIVNKCTWELWKTSKNDNQRTCVFDCYQIPDMSIEAFLERTFRYIRISSQVYIVAYVYIDRLCQIHPQFQITSCNVYRLLITTIMVASKFVEDRNYKNSYFAKVGGLTTREINKLEVEFLFLMGFKLNVNVSIFKSYCSHLEREVSIGGGYEIEKTLQLLCSEEIKAKGHGGERDLIQISCLTT